MQATYQTRIEGNDEALSAYAALYGRVQRRLFAEVSSGRSAASKPIPRWDVHFGILKTTERTARILI